MRIQKLFLLAMVAFLGTGVFAFVRGQQALSPPHPLGDFVPATLPAGDLRARPIGEILAPKSQKLSPPRAQTGQAAQAWKSEPLPPPAVSPVSGEAPSVSDPASGESLSQKLQAIRRTMTKETGKPADAGAAPTEAPKPIPAADASVPAGLPSTSGAIAAKPAPIGASNASSATSARESGSAKSSRTAGSPAASDAEDSQASNRTDAANKNPSDESATPKSEPAPRFRSSEGGSSRRVISADEESKPIAPKAAREAGLSESAPRAVGGSAPGTVLSSRGPQIRLETIGPKALTVGKPASYTITLTSGAGAAAQGLEAVIDVPTSLTLQSSQATIGSVQLQSSQQGISYLKWSIPNLEANGKAQLTMQVLPADARPVDLRVEWAVQSQVATTRVEVQEPKLALALDGPRELLFGEKKTFTITLSNPGSGDAENVVLVLPAGFGGGNQVERSVGVIAAGQKKVIEVEVVPRDAGPLQLSLQARGDGKLQAAASADLVVRRANLMVRLESPKLKYLGTEGNLRLLVQNTGDAPADNVVANVVLPAGVQFVSSPDHPKTGDKGRLGWNVGKLPPGGEKLIEFRCQFAAEGQLQIEAVATAAGELVASESGATQVEALADLKLEINDPQGPIQVGDEVKYEIKLTNRGTKSAQNVRVNAFFSEGLEPITAEGASGRVQPGQVNFEPLAHIEPGQKVKLYITAKAMRSGDHRFRGEVDYGAPAMRLAAEDTTRFIEGDSAPATGKREPASIGLRSTSPAKLDSKR